MIKALHKAIYYGMKIQRAIGAVCLLAIVLIVTAGTISRYLFNSPFAWTEELVTILFIWLSFLGAGAVSGKRGHVAVDFITGKFNPKVQNAVRVVCSVLIIVLLAIMFVGAIALLPTMTHVTVALRIPRYIYYIPIMIASFYMILVYVEDLLKYFRPELYEGITDDVATA